MLDEFKEYEEYIKHIEYDSQEATNKNRILVQAGKPNLIGIYRVLTMLARYELFEREDKKSYYALSDEKDEKRSQSQKANRREEVYDALACWCGLEDSESEEVKATTPQGAIYQLFRRRAFKLKDENNSGEKLSPEEQNALKEKQAIDLFNEFKDMKKKKTGWMVKNPYNILEFAKPNIYAFNFNIVIADALQQGPFQRRKMICKKDYYKEFSLNPKKESQLLKLIAACMLIKDYSYEEKDIDEIYTYQCFNLDKQAVANWMNYASFANPVKHMDYFEDYVYSVKSANDDRASYPVVKIENGIVKLFNPYLEACDFRIVNVDYEFTEAEKENYIHIEDQGFSMDLTDSLSDLERGKCYLMEQRLLEEYVVVTIERGGPTKQKNHYPFYIVTGIDYAGYENILMVKPPYIKDETGQDKALKSDEKSVGADKKAAKADNELASDLIYQDIMEELARRGVRKIHFFADYDEDEAPKDYEDVRKVIKKTYKEVIFVKDEDFKVTKLDEKKQEKECKQNIFKKDRLYNKITKDIYKTVKEEIKLLGNKNRQDDIQNLSANLPAVVYNIMKTRNAQKIVDWDYILKALERRQ